MDRKIDVRVGYRASGIKLCLHFIKTQIFLMRHNASFLVGVGGFHCLCIMGAYSSRGKQRGGADTKYGYQFGAWHCGPPFHFTASNLKKSISQSGTVINAQR